MNWIPSWALYAALGVAAIAVIALMPIRGKSRTSRLQIWRRSDDPGFDVSTVSLKQELTLAREAQERNRTAV